MTQEIVIHGQTLQTKEYDGKRVVTFEDIDRVHQRPKGTAKRNFAANKKHLVEGEDYRIISMDEIRTMGIKGYNYPNGLTIFTESGYLLLVKSFTDNLAWQVQRELVSSYFRLKVMIKSTAAPFDLRTVVDLITQTRAAMRDNGADPAKIALTMKEIGDKYGVEFPAHFVEPERTTVKDVSEWVDLIYSFPKGKCPLASYEDLVTYQISIKRLTGGVNHEF